MILGAGKLAAGFWLAVPALVLLVSLALAWALRDFLVLEALKTHHAALARWRADNMALALAGFFAVYLMAASLALPGIFVLTVAAGYLFGPVTGTLVVVAAATLGAMALFGATRLGLGEWLLEHRAQNGPMQGRMASFARALRRNEFRAMLLMRMTPVVPFFLCNTLPGALGARMHTFVLSTAMGILPGTLVLTLSGSGLSEVLEAGGTPELDVLAPLLLVVPAIVLLTIVTLRGMRDELPAGKTRGQSGRP